MLEYGLDISLTQSDELKDLADPLYQFYLKTIEKKYSYAYLQKSFFHHWFELDPSVIRLWTAKKQGELQAMALHASSSDCLFGRYWGGHEHYPLLHFELCYYQAIEHAIENHIPIIQAGAQGPQKLLRGYEPTTIKSFHYCFQPEFQNAVDRFVQNEKIQVENERINCLTASPLKNSKNS